MKEIAIIGGGISGLAAAFEFEKMHRAGVPLKYTIFESSGRVGGALLTEHIDGCLVEGGADSFLTEKPWAADLCRELGIGDQLIGSNDEQRQTLILHDGKLAALPNGMKFFVPTDFAALKESPLFSAAAKRRIAQEEMMKAPAAATRDESVGDFVTRHFGKEVLERVADPMLAGIYGGDAHQLSMRAVLPRFLDMEKATGSLVRALIAASDAEPASRQPLFTSLKGGMQQLIDSLVKQLAPTSMQTRAEVTGLRVVADRWRLHVGDEWREFDAVVLAVPAFAAAHLLKTVSPNAEKLLRNIPYSSSLTVALGYSTESAEGEKLSQLKGHGFLVPRREGRRLLACTFVRNKFPGRVGEGRGLLRVFFGGVRDDAALRLSNEQLIRLANRELQSILKVKLEPLFVRLQRWPRAMPQYLIGHVERCGQIRAEVAHLPGVALSGNGYNGVGVSDCVREGRRAASLVAAQLERAVPAT